MDSNGLALRAQQGDQHARDSLFAIALIACKQLALRHTVPRYADDLSMDMIEELLKQLPKWDPERSTFMTWMRVVSNSVGTAHSAEEGQGFDSDYGHVDLASGGHAGLTTIGGPYELVEAEDDRSYLRCMLGKLPYKYRRVMQWGILDDVGVGEMARRLKTSPGTLRVRLHRAKVALQQVLETEKITNRTLSKRIGDV